MHSRTIPTASPFMPEFGARPAPSYSLFGGNGMNGMQAAAPVPPVQQYKPPTGWQNQPVAADDCNQLDLDALMPRSWRDAGAGVLTGDDKGWSRNTVTKEGYNKYISSVGAARVGRIDRNPRGKTVGNTFGMNTFRKEALPALTLGEDAVVFNDSSERQALVSNTYRNYYGCGF